MYLDGEDKEFEELLLQKRHDELNSSIKNIASVLQSENALMIRSIQEQTKKMEQVSMLLTELKKLEKPKYELPNNDALTKSISYLCEEIVSSNNRVIESIENRLLPDSFTLVKNYQGMTTSVNVNYKQANRIKK
jgi:hypothetical protein